MSMAHIFPREEYHGMSGSALKNPISEVMIMCNNNFCGGNIWWIIILLILFCGCGNGNNGMWNNNCGCDSNCGCC